MTGKLRLVFIALVVMVCIVPARAQNIYAGRGTGLEVNVLSLIGIRVADTGWLPPSGGNIPVSVGSAHLTSGLLTVVDTGILSAQTSGAAGVVNSYARVDGLRILPGLTPSLDVVRASIVRSDATASLGTYGGSSTITNLMVLGNTITVTGAPNQGVFIPGVVNLTINRQTVTNGVLRVDALHVELLDIANAGTVSVATSYAGIVPEPSSAYLAGLALPGMVGVYLRRRRNNSG